MAYAQAGGRVDGEIHSVADELTGFKNTVAGGLHDASASGRRVLQAAGTAARDTADDLRKSAHRAGDGAARFVSQRPVTSIALAAGAGLILGALCRSAWR